MHVLYYNNILKEITVIIMIKVRITIVLIVVMLTIIAIIMYIILYYIILYYIILYCITSLYYIIYI